MRTALIRCLVSVGIVSAAVPSIAAADSFNILEFAPPGTQVDQSGKADASAALSAAITAANKVTATGAPACVYIPAGVYKISHNPPEFTRAGCVKGDGPTQSTLILDQRFAGDLFTWSEAWALTTAGSTAVGIRIIGARAAAKQQNAFVFYDWNDEVFINQVIVTDLPGRALLSGVPQHTSEGYMRESHLRSLRLFNDGLPDVAVVEFNSAGAGDTDATNEVRLHQIDIYGARGPSFVIRNAGAGVIRNITIDALRIEGREQGDVKADLLTIGDPVLRGAVNHITLTGLELIDVSSNFAALHITAPQGAEVPYSVTVYGMIGGGLSRGKGLVIDAARLSAFHLSSISSQEANVTVGPHVRHILLDGNGLEVCWTYNVHPDSSRQILSPSLTMWDKSGPQMNTVISPRC